AGGGTGPGTPPRPPAVGAPPSVTTAARTRTGRGTNSSPGPAFNRLIERRQGRGRENGSTALPLPPARPCRMNIGLTFDLKEEAADPSAPDDAQEEFDSPATIEAIAAVLRGLGHEVTLLGDGRPMLERLLAGPPDFVFNLAEGHGVSRSREARGPAVLGMVGRPCHGPGPPAPSVN